MPADELQLLRAACEKLAANKAKQEEEIDNLRKEITELKKELQQTSRASGEAYREGATEPQCEDESARAKLMSPQPQHVPEPSGSGLVTLDMLNQAIGDIIS